MKSFRTPRYLERYEDVVFELENPLNIREVNTQHQNRDGLKFIADKSGETTPFDWYNARLSVDFKVKINLQMLLLLLFVIILAQSMDQIL